MRFTRLMGEGRRQLYWRQPTPRPSPDRGGEDRINGLGARR
ncbi:MULTISPECIES: hypothetical protein [Okeania]|nr:MULTISPECIES: hypothetical protein [Okeania]